MISENLVQNQVKEHFEHECFTVYEEVPMLGNRIDIVATKKGGSEVIAVEVKVSDWKRAVQQAVLYRLVADRVYVAIWEDFVHRVDFDVLRHFGIGVLEVNGYAKCVLPARTSRIIHETVRKRVMQTMKNGGLENGGK